MKQNKTKNKNPFPNYLYFILKKKTRHYSFILLSDVRNPGRQKRKPKPSVFEGKHLNEVPGNVRFWTLHEARFSPPCTYHIGKVDINSFKSSVSLARGSIETGFFLLILLDIFYDPRT